MTGAAAELPDRMGSTVKREEDPRLENYTQQPIIDSFHRLMTSNTFFIKLVLTIQKGDEMVTQDVNRRYEDFSLLYALRRVGEHLQMDGTYIQEIIVNETKRASIETTEEQNEQLRKERLPSDSQSKQEMIRTDDVKLSDVDGLDCKVLEEIIFSDEIIRIIKYQKITGGFDAVIYADGGAYLE
mgnify:CR=1 FL=1